MLGSDKRFSCYTHEYSIEREEKGLNGTHLKYIDFSNKSYK